MKVFYNKLNDSLALKLKEDTPPLGEPE